MRHGLCGMDVPDRAAGRDIEHLTSGLLFKRAKLFHSHRNQIDSVSWVTPLGLY